MEFIFEFLAELLLQILFEALAELGLHSLKDTLRTPHNPVLSSRQSASGNISFMYWTLLDTY